MEQFVLSVIDTQSGNGFAYPACSISANTTIYGLIELPCDFHVVSDQVTHFTAEEVWQWEFTGLTTTCHPQKQLA